MKKSKLFRRSTLLFAIIALAVVLTVGVIAGVSMANEEPEATVDYGEKYAAVNVATSGKVSLKFYYSDCGTATGFVAEIIDPTGETATKTIEYAKEDLPKTENGFCVEVPLAPSQMTYTVKVYANGTEGYGTPITYSVREYALDVLADENYAEHHDAMRALLNWGAMAQTKFADATSVPANTGLFERNTNSIFGVDTISYEKGVVTHGTTITGAEMNLSLEPNNVAIHFYVNYEGNGTLTAKVSKDGAEAVDTAITQTEKGWLVRIANVPVTLYDTPYTVTVTDGTDTFTATKTVREYLGVLLAQCNEDGDLNTGNAVRAMYQLYQFVTGNTGAETCQHGNRGAMYWLKADEDSSFIRCNLCHAYLSSKAIDDVISDYIPGALLQYGSQTGSADVTAMSENGIQFVRVDNMWGNRDNWGDISLVNALSSNTVTGQYMVIKYRIGAGGNASTYIEGFANTNLGSEKNLTGNGEFKIVHGAKGEWVTAVIDLSTRVVDPSITFLPTENGSYDVQYISFRLFPYAAQTVTDDSAAGRYLYTYKYTVNGSAKYESFQNTKLTEEQLAEKVAEHPDYELFKIGKQTTSADAYVDVAYVAFADSMADIKTLIDTNTYTVSVSNSANEVYNTADDSCAHASRDANEYHEGNTYYYGKCPQCGEYLYSRTLEDSVKAFYSPYMISYTSKADPTNPRVHYNFGSKAFAVDANEAYFGFVGKDGALQFIWNRGPGVNGYAAGNDQDYTVDIGNAKYFVIKMRVSTTNLSKTFGLMYSTTGVDSSTYSAMPIASATAGEWETYIIDLAKVYGSQHALDAESGTYKVDTFYFHSDGFASTTKFDIAYMAFVEGDLTEVAKLVDTDTALIQTATSGTATRIDGETGKCVGECVTSVQVIDGVYKTACAACGDVVRDHGVKADAVNGYWSAEYLYTCLTQTGTSASGWSSITGKYHQKELITEDGETFIRIGNAETNHADNGPWAGWFIGSSDGLNGVPGAGRYMVMKVRQNNNSVNVSSLSMWITSKEGFSSWASGSVSVALPEDNQWHVIVVDLAARSSVYKPTAATGEYDLATFHVRPFGGGSSVDNATDEVMDIAYIAFFDELTDLKDIVKEDSFEFSKSGTSSSVLDTATGACKYHAPTYVADADDARGYHYECAECGDKLAMDYYESGKGGCFIYNNGQYAGTYTLKTDKAGFQYMSFLSTGTTGTFFNYNANNNGGGGVSANAVRAGRYLVMKIKGETAQNVTFYVGTDDYPKSNNNYVGGLAATFSPETMPKDWTVVVFDLAQIPNYSIGENHKIFMSSTTGGGSVVKTGAQVDIAYMMIVNDFDDIAALTANETVKSFVIPDEINWYANLDTMNKFQHSLSKNLYDSEEGVSFNRFTGTGGNHLNLTGGSGAGAATSGTFPTGKYIAIKYRLWVENGTGTFNLNVATGDKKSGNGKSISSALNYTTVEQGEWRVAFVDASHTAQWTSDGSAQSIYMMITTGGSGKYTFDIAWVAVVDSVEEMRSLLIPGETYYDVGQDWSKAGTHYNYDGTCAVHNANLANNAQTRVEGENTTYYYICTTCGGECYAKTVPTTSAYLGPKYVTQAVTYYQTTNSGLTIVDGNVVGRVTGKTTSTSQVIWLRNENDMTTNQYTSEAENETVNIGKAKYLIIKVQVNGADLTGWNFTFSTTGFNRVLSDQLTPMVRNSSYVYEDEEGKEHFLVKAEVDAGTATPEEGWTQKMVNVVTKNGMQSFKLPTAAIEQGEWVVFAIDLQTVLSTSYVADESGDYIIDSFYTNLDGLAAGATIDFAYLAYAEDWQGVDDIVDEATIIEVTNTTGSYNVVTVADHITVAE